MSIIVADDTIMYHIGLSRAMLSGVRYAILPGDPGRVEKICQALGKYVVLNFNREYKSALVTINAEPVLVCSTGMGGPSVAICLEELATLGVEKFIRVGTTGAIQEKISIGDIVINTGAIRLDGTSTHYAPLEYPAIADVYLAQAFIKIAKEEKVNFHVGLSVSSDTFWPGQERYNSYTGYVLNKFRGSLKEWQALGALNYEMETATLFTLGQVFGLQAISICLVVAKRTDSEAVLEKNLWSKLENQMYQYLKTSICYCQKNNI